MTFENEPVVIDVDGVEQGRTRIDTSGATVRIAVAADRERFERELLTTLNGGVGRPAISAASNDATQYFLAVEAIVAEMSDATESLFQAPLEQELEAIEKRAETGALTPEDAATIRAFFAGFWTGADEHLQTFRAALRELDPPASVRSEHDDYVAAVNALIETTDVRLAEIATRDPAEQLSSLWEPDDEVEAMNAACEALGAAASDLGVDAETCP